MLTRDRGDISGHVFGILCKDDGKAQSQVEVNVAMHDPRAWVVSLYTNVKHCDESRARDEDAL